MVCADSEITAINCLSKSLTIIKLLNNCQRLLSAEYTVSDFFPTAESLLAQFYTNYFQQWIAVRNH
jgi:hypothetical protein